MKKKYNIIKLDPTKIKNKFSAEDYFVILLILTPFVAVATVWVAWFYDKLK